ncbi:spinocerebellar ataxia type 10 protein domain-containing protein [Polychytrium aggregatum]|uniref:spinocerebellar ataxia type 10 protein domain-containing protein n=1 Tax=Polychytrium aggregatum TaxID=110093 RepID=UPI0022FE6E1F|nr:spinocerebellar ataxia type 10 protein domain-containing protein [Polychytrium aggregatum]KAI9190840.1 spinocerebellar ataxia type 10 protein domain-containing protein [Polychytrium aggregatum]
MDRNNIFQILGIGSNGVACQRGAILSLDVNHANLLLVRNLCAAVPDNQSSACAHNIYVTVSEILSYLCCWLTSTTDPAADVQQKAITCINIGTQTLANMMTGNADVMNRCWPTFFTGSDVLIQLLQIPNDDTCRYALMWIFNSINKDRTRSLYLLQTPPGRLVLKELLNKTTDSYPDDEVFTIIYAVFCSMVELDLTGEILMALMKLRQGEGCKSLVPSWALNFFKLLDGIIETRYRNHSTTGITLKPALNLAKMAGAFVDFLKKETESIIARIPNGIERIIYIAEQAVRSQRSHLQEIPEQLSTASEGDAADEEIRRVLFGNELDALVLVLQCLAKVAYDMDTEAKVRLCQESTLLKSLLDLLSLAEQLHPRKKLASAKTMNLEPDLEVEHRGLFMLKCDAIKVIGNLCYHCKEIQDEMRNIGVIQVVLNHCTLDDNNPFIREYALFAIRNLCYNNLENQALIDSLEARGVAQSQDLNEMGVEAVIDEDGKLRLQRAKEQSDSSMHDV